MGLEAELLRVKSPMRGAATPLLKPRKVNRTDDTRGAGVAPKNTLQIRASVPSSNTTPTSFIFDWRLTRNLPKNAEPSRSRGRQRIDEANEKRISQNRRKQTGRRLSARASGWALPGSSQVQQ